MRTIEERLVAEARMRVRQAQNRTTTWAHHPTYDTRKDVRAAWAEAWTVATFAARVLTDGIWTVAEMKDLLGIDPEALERWRDAVEASPRAWVLRNEHLHHDRLPQILYPL